MLNINKIKITATLFLALVAFTTYGQSNKFKVALDAGHGDHDPGARYNGHIEKNITLAIVLKVGKILESVPKIDVIYTRKTDVFIDLIERANIANRADATIFVSIHCNANTNTVADGTETYVMGMTKVASNLAAAKKENSVITLEKDYKQKYEGFDPNSPETMIGMTLMQEEYLDNSISLASKVEDSFADLGRKIRGGGVKQAPYMVLHKAYMPRVLIETGFISNPVEGNFLDSEDGQNEIAKSIASAIISYKNEYYGYGEPDVQEVKSTLKNIEKPIKDTSTIIKPKLTINTAEINKSISVSNGEAVVFKIQFSASTKKMELESKNFKGLKNISFEKEGNVYKYLCGETSVYDEAKINLAEAKSKGYNSAFLVATKNGKKISIQEARK